MKIPILDLTPEIQNHWDELNQVIQEVLHSGHFILGENVSRFEKEIASYLGVKFAVGMNSGTDALVIGLRSMGIKPGDEVITTPFTFFATAEAISLIGAVPVFADIEEFTFNIDVDQIESKMTPKTKAILPVHLFGQAAEMAPIMEIARKHNLLVLEDVAQAFGAEYNGKKLGAWGTASIFSFFPTKNLGAFGDAGLLATDDEAVADMALRLRHHGSTKRYHHEDLGYASRLDELQAAVLRVKLPHVDENNRKRRLAASRYREMLAKIQGVVVPPEVPEKNHVYHQFTVRITGGRRDEVHRTLAENEISTMIYYPIPVHRLEVYGKTYPSLPISEAAASEVLSLPLWPDITPEIQFKVATAIRAALA